MKFTGLSTNKLLAEKQNIPSQQIHATEQLETAKKTKAIAGATQSVLNTINEDIYDLEIDLNQAKSYLFFLVTKDKKFILHNSLTREQLNIINQQIQTWYNAYGEVDDHFFPLSLGSSIYELASYAHVLSADVVYEADDDTELVWTNPKLQKQWIDLHNLMSQKTEVGKDYAEAFAKIDCIKKQLEEKKKTEAHHSFCSLFILFTHCSSNVCSGRTFIYLTHIKHTSTTFYVFLIQLLSKHKLRV